MRKYLIIFIHNFLYQIVQSKIQLQKIFFDSNWQETSKDSAFFYTNFVKADTAYKVTSYWVKSNKLNAVSIYADTTFRKGIGLTKHYYESGILSDSGFFNNKGKLEAGYHYTENGKLDYHFFYDAKTGGLTGERYDSSGKKN